MFKLPKYYQALKPHPEEGKNTHVFGAKTDGYMCEIKIFPVPKNELIPFDKELVISGMHNCLKEKEGLLEVSTGKTNSGIEYLYIITKSKLYPSGVEYFLRILLKEDIFAEEIDCFAREKGITGIRDTTIYGMLGLKDFDGWMKDPYDENYKKGLLMNLSEDRKYDEMFPGHPLSEIRRVLDYIISNN